VPHLVVAFVEEVTVSTAHARTFGEVLARDVASIARFPALAFALGTALAGIANLSLLLIVLDLVIVDVSRLVLNRSNMRLDKKVALGAQQN
jgi:hypothetical protein